MGRSVIALAVVAGCSFGGNPVDPTGDGAPGDGPSADAPPGAADAPPGQADAAPGAPDAQVDASWTTCPGGYTPRAPGSCYRIVGTARTWPEAEADCETAGAHLAVIDDAAEQAFISGSSVWIGATENVTPGTFLWVTGAPMGFTGWASGEPGSVGGASCVESRAAPDGWHDDNGPEAKPYACEYDGRSADPALF